MIQKGMIVTATGYMRSKKRKCVQIEPGDKIFIAAKVNGDFVSGLNITYSAKTKLKIPINILKP